MRLIRQSYASCTWCIRYSDVRHTPRCLYTWLIVWGLTPFLTISQSYHGGQFTYSCVSWFSHTSTPHNNLPKQLAAFPHRISPLVEDEWRMSHWLLSNVGKKVGRVGIRTYDPWIDSPRRYRLNYRDSVSIYNEYNTLQIRYNIDIRWTTLLMHHQYASCMVYTFMQNTYDQRTIPMINVPLA